MSFCGLPNSLVPHLRLGWRQPISPPLAVSKIPRVRVRLRQAGRLWDRAALSAWYAVAVTVALAVVGVLGSVFTPEIKAARAPFWSAGSTSPPATFFWLSLALTGLLFWRQRKAEMRATAEERRRLVQRSQRLQREQETVAQRAADLRREQREGFDLLQSMPPPGFLEHFTALYAVAEAANDALLSDDERARDAEEIHRTIQTILASYARLAQAYDNAPTATYAANIMLYHRAKEVPEDARGALEGRLKFCDEATGIDKLRGVLDLRTEMSVTVGPAGGADGPSMDGDLYPIALPVPRTARHPVRVRTGTRGKRRVEKWKVLPGAPMAFYERRAEFYADTDELIRWCEEEGTFDEVVLGDLQSYFTLEAPPYIGSLAAAAIPLGSPLEIEPIGVVNLHRRAPGMLKERTQSAETFVQTSSPLLFLLYRLLTHLQAVETEKFGRWRNLRPPEPVEKTPTGS